MALAVLAFGDSRHAAVSTLGQSLTKPFAEQQARFVKQWERMACKESCIDVAAGDGGKLVHTSYKLLLAHEDKTFPGALIASGS